MSEINNKDELWRVIATGVLNELEAKMQAVAGESTDKLKLLNERRDFLAWARVEFVLATALGFAFSESVRGALWDLVQRGADYDPQIAPQDPPFVTGATVTGGNTLVADAPPEGYTTTVYQLVGRTFTLIGPLADNPSSGAGNYVLSNAVTDPGSLSSPGLPSLFLALTS